MWKSLRSVQLVARNRQGFERNSVVHQDARYVEFRILRGEEIVRASKCTNSLITLPYIAIWQFDFSHRHRHSINQQQSAT